MHADPTVSPMTRADLKRVCEIEQDSFAAPWTPQMLKEAWRMKDAIALVLRAAGTVQGYVFALAAPSDALLHIVNLAVAPQARRKGYGRTLLRGVLERGRDAGCVWAGLEVRTHNQAAIKLYEKFGFRILRRLPAYYEDGSDAYLMGAATAQALSRLKEET